MVEMRESFSWLTDSLKTIDVGPNKIRIKGVALRNDIVSRNNRLYVANEIEKSARTLSGKPLLINHDPKLIVGNIEFAEPEGDSLEYVAICNKQPYVTMLRERDQRIKGVSVAASFLHAKCTHCQKQFEDLTKLGDHMISEHGIRNFQVEPHQIIFDSLSLVCDPETPGVENTMPSIMETTAHKLFETVLKSRPDTSEFPKLETRPMPDFEVNPLTGKPTPLKAQLQENVGVVGDVVLTEKPKLSIAEPCSPELKACVDKLIADGKEESNAWAICKAQLGEVEQSKEATSDINEWITKQANPTMKHYADCIDKLTEDVKQLKAENSQLKQATSDHAIKETAEHNKLKENYDKILKENTELVNFKDKVRGKFKGVSQKVSGQSDSSYGVNPLTGK